MRVATYSRVSTDHHRQNPELQVQELRRYCEGRQWQIVEEIVDHGYSGGTDQRPGLKQLMVLARSQKIDAIVVTRLDRLFRSLLHLVRTLSELDLLDVKFVSVGDAIDWTTPSGRLLGQILGCLAEFHRALLRERTVMGLAHARSKGKRLGRPRVHDEAAIVRLRNSGLSYREIQRRLGVPAGCISRAVKRARKTSPKASDGGSTNTGT